MSKILTFEATVYAIAHNRCVDVPPAIAEAIPGSVPIPVEVRIGAGRSKSSIVAAKTGYRLFLSRDVRGPAGIDKGDLARVGVIPDPSGGEPELPADLVAALGAVGGAMEMLLVRSPADRRQVVRWLESARTAATRRSRVKQAVDRILKGPPPKRRKSARG